MRRIVMVMFAVLMLFFSGCGLVSYTSMNQGTEITKDQLAEIKPGMTKQDVLTALGEPTSVKDVGDNKVWFFCWQRGYDTHVLFGTFGSNNAKSYCATVIFDKDGKVLRTGKGRAGQASITPTFTIKQEKVTKKKETTW